MTAVSTKVERWIIKAIVIRKRHVSHLALRDTGSTPGNGLQQLIKWPQALQTLSTEACTAGHAGYLDPLCSSEMLFDALQGQRETLT